MKKFSWFLKASVVWSAFVWITLVKNMITDETHPMSFRVVHCCIAVVSLLFAGGTWFAAREMDKTVGN